MPLPSKPVSNIFALTGAVNGGCARRPAENFKLRGY